MNPLFNLVIKCKRTGHVSIHKGWLMKTVHLLICFCNLLDYYISSCLCRNVACPLGNVRSVFWNHGHCVSLDKWALLNRRTDSSFCEGRAISCHKCQSSLLGVLIICTLPIPHQKPKNLSILETSGEESWVENPTTPLVRKFFLNFILGRFPSPFWLVFKGL